VYDVAIIGASVAGSAAARMFAMAGARVALVEQRPDPNAYKVTCTHAVLPAATPVLGRLGVTATLEERGVPRTHAELWTPYSGWASTDAVPDGWGVTRQTLDPLLRDLAVQSPEVDYLPGWTAHGLRIGDGGPSAVELESRDHRARTVRARLVVGADGRGSRVAGLAGLPGRVWPHRRFFHFAYWRGIQSQREGAGPAIRLWLDHPDAASEFPNEDGLTVLVTVFHESRRAAVRRDLESAYLQKLVSLPDGPDLSRAERVSKILGKLDTPNVIRPAGRPGVAFIGDAAIATDPVFGCGISFALLTASWLVDAVAADLRDRRTLDAGLRRYRRQVLWRLGPHHLQIADFSRGREPRPIEQRMFRVGASDPVVARALGEVMTRAHSPLRLLDPRVVRRLVRPPNPITPLVPDPVREVEALCAT
jgi:2-polyprenyl-6-methoxyphenol hydroxylase-like FAD-dependent oxidoreductase